MEWRRTPRERKGPNDNAAAGSCGAGWMDALAVVFFLVVGEWLVGIEKGRRRGLVCGRMTWKRLVVLRNAAHLKCRMLLSSSASKRMRRSSSENER
jgi:hypothetical protein